MPARWREVAPDAGAGLLIALGGAWFTWEATQLRAGPGYAAVGPQVFPAIVGLGLLGSGLAVLVGAARGTGAGGGADREAAVPAGAPGEPPSQAAAESAGATPGTDWATLGQMAVLLLLYVLLFRPLGFVLATVLFVFGGARVLGSRSPGRDAVVAVLLTLITFAVFVFFLGLELPAGPLEPAVEALRRLAGPAPRAAVEE